MLYLFFMCVLDLVVKSGTSAPPSIPPSPHLRHHLIFKEFCTFVEPRFYVCYHPYLEITCAFEVQK